MAKANCLFDRLRDGHNCCRKLLLLACALLLLVILEPEEVLPRPKRS